MSSGNRIYRANGDRFYYDDATNHVQSREGDWGNYNYVHDGLGRLRKVFYSKAETPDRIKLRWEADYDALGRRTHKRRYRKGGRQEAWEFFWDGDRLGAEVLPDGRVRVYVYAGETSLVPMLALEYADAHADPESARVFVFSSDHRGAVERVEDEHGEVVWEATVHPYGNIEVFVGEDFHQPFRLVGQYDDPGLNLHYNRYRYWSPELGRFMQSDPLGLAGGMNVYAWPGCPLRVSDPLGLGCGGKKKGKGNREGEVDQEDVPRLRGVSADELALAGSESTIAAARAARQKVIESFLAEHGLCKDKETGVLRKLTPGEIRDQLDGHDLDRPVTVGPPPGAPTPQYQRQRPGGSQGSYYSDADVLPTEVGIAGFVRGKGGRYQAKELSGYDIRGEAPYLESTAAPAVDSWSVFGQPVQTRGGGVQRMIPDRSQAAPLREE